MLSLPGDLLFVSEFIDFVISSKDISASQRLKCSLDMLGVLLLSIFILIKMVLDLLKWLKETSFYERKKEIITKTWTLHKKKIYIKKRGRVYEFLDKGKVDIMDFCEQKEILCNPGSW